MRRQICTGLYASLILCSHLQYIISSTASATENSKLVKETSKDSKDQDDIAKLDFETNKRGWKDNTMQVWGKRSSDESEIDHSEHPYKLSHVINQKRKWGQSNMPVWGKRSFDDKNLIELRESDSLLNEDMEKDKRKWGANSMTVWGKRSDAQAESISEYNKRKWGENSMTVWGKRSAHHVAPQGFLESKRKWGDNTMSVWGKRSDVESSNMRHEAELERLGADKRKWSDNTMQVWGKRSYTKPNHHSVSKRSVRSLEGGYDDLINDKLLRFSSSGDRYSNNFEFPKRSWETNTMPVWGKRGGYLGPQRSLSADLDNDWRRLEGLVPASYSYRMTRYGHPEKRAWSSENELRVWG